MKRVIFIKNTIILSACALSLRLAGVAFKIWLSARVGSEAIGLYQIIMSVYIFAASFATSGLSTAVTRLTTDELATSRSGVRNIVSRGLLLSLIVAAFSFLVLFFCADFIALRFIGDPRAALSVKIMAAGLIFMGLCSCLRGYFLARRNALSSSLSQILEQVVRIAVIAVLLSVFGYKSVTLACAAIVIGDATAEAASALFLFVLYRLDSKKKKNYAAASPNITKKLINIALPITSGRYLSSLLRTLESAAVPRLFVSYGMTSAAALSHFGVIKGMALPLLLFPSAILNAVSLLLIPELSEARAKKSALALRSTVLVTLRITTIISVFVGFVFLLCGERLGVLLYGDVLVGKTVKWLAPLTPLMYIDSIADGMLKGLDKQKQTFYYAVADSGMRLILIYLILPRYGFAGFIFIMYLSNIFTAVLHFRLLITTAKIRLYVLRFFALPLFLGFAACYISKAVLSSFGLSNLWFVILFCTASALIYFVSLLLSGGIRRDDFI